MSEDIKESVREHYARAAQVGSCCSPGCGCGDAGTVVDSRDLGYSPDQLADAPAGADLGLGCGNPTAMASLEPGMTILDLGSGPGLDCFLAAKRVGPTGHVIGVDMTPEMIALARANARTAGFPNVEFRLGEIEAMPVEAGTVDVIISNCVLNLVPDKSKAFSEAFRVLKPGGRLSVSDIVLDGELSETVLGSIEAYASCVAGALERGVYLGLMDEAGFTDIRVESDAGYAEMTGPEEAASAAQALGIPAEEAADAARIIRSISVTATKPAG